MQYKEPVDRESRDSEIVAEAHHRVKNTLQNIISYVNVMFASREQVSREELLKLTRYVHSLSLIHDVLLREVQSNGSAKKVRLDRILQDFAELYALEMELEVEDIPPALTSTRRAATVSLILNELLDNSKRYGSGNVSLQCGIADQSHLRIAVKNDLSAGQSGAAVVQGNGLRISSLLAQRDLESSLETVVSEGKIASSFLVPVELI